MESLGEINKFNNVKSINIPEGQYWDIMWEAYFLMKKELYFEQQTYYPKSVALKGEWDLLRGQEKYNTSDEENKVILGGKYLLKKRKIN